MTRTIPGLLPFDSWQEKNEMCPLKTYFEQIPVARVKEIAEPLLDTDESENDGISIPQAHNNATPAPDSWREIAQQVQKETNPTKVIELVQQLIARFDEQERTTTIVPSEKPPTEKTRTPSAD